MGNMMRVVITMMAVTLTLSKRGKPERKDRCMWGVKRSAEMCFVGVYFLRRATMLTSTSMSFIGLGS